MVVRSLMAWLSRFVSYARNGQFIFKIGDPEYIIPFNISSRSFYDTTICIRFRYRSPVIGSLFFLSVIFPRMICLLSVAAECLRCTGKPAGGRQDQSVQQTFKILPHLQYDLE